WLSLPLYIRGEQSRPLILELPVVCPLSVDFLHPSPPQRSVDTLEARVRARLQALDDAHLGRTLRQPAGIDLSSNDYLGLSQHPLIKARMAEAIEAEGVGSTGSRLLRGHRDCLTSLERRFASFKRAARSLYFSSGYLANIGVLTTLPEQRDI